MFILIGSENPVKIEATKLAFERFFHSENVNVKGMSVDSNVSDQPIGINEILKGAENRARNVKKKLYDQTNAEKPSFFVGIEAGLIPLPNGNYIDYQYCIIRDSQGHMG